MNKATLSLLKITLMILLGSIGLFAQNFESQFSEIRIDRKQGPSTYHGGLNVENSTGRASMTIPLGAGIGARGARFTPVMSPSWAPQAGVTRIWSSGGNPSMVYGWSTPSISSCGQMSSLAWPGYLSLKHFGLDASSIHFPDGSSTRVNLAYYTPSILTDGFDDSSISALLATFGINGSGWSYDVGTEGAGNRVLALSGQGDLVVGITDSTHPSLVSENYLDTSHHPFNCSTPGLCPSGKSSFPARIVVFRGGSAYVFQFSANYYKFYPAGTAKLDGQVVQPTIDWNQLNNSIYQLAEIHDRHQGLITFKYGDGKTDDLIYKATWTLSGANSQSLSVHAYAPWWQMHVPIPHTVTYDSMPDQPTYTMALGKLQPPDFPGNTDEIGFYSDASGVQRLESDAWLETPPWTEMLVPSSLEFPDKETITWNYEITAYPDYDTLNYKPPFVLKHVNLPGRRVDLDWAYYEYMKPRNGTIDTVVPSYVHMTCPAMSWGVTAITETDLASGAIRKTMHDRVVPVPIHTLFGQVGLTGPDPINTYQVPVEFKDTITHPDGSKTIEYFARPSNTGIDDDPIAVLAFLKHQSLGASELDSIGHQYFSHGGDRFDVRTYFNPTGDPAKNTVIYPTRAMTGDADLGILTITEQQSWDEASYGWMRTQELRDTSDSPGVQWELKSLPLQGKFPSHSRPFERDVDRTFSNSIPDWLLARVATEQTTIQKDNTGSLANPQGLPYVFGQVSRNFLPHYNTVTKETHGGTDVQIQVDFTTKDTTGLGAALVNSAKVTGLNGVPNLSNGVVGASYDHDGYGLVNKIQRNGMAWSVYEAHDGLGRPISQTNPNGDLTQFSWDSSNRLITINPPTPEVLTSIDYDNDALGMQITRGEQVSKVRFNGFGEPIWEARRTVDNSLKDVWSHRSNGYDAAGRLIWKTGWIEGLGTDTIWNAPAAPDEKSTLMSYDGRGRLIQVVNPNQEVVTYAYSGRSRTVTTGLRYDKATKKGLVTPETASTTFTSDILGRLVLVTDAMGQPTIYQYDPAGRVVVVKQTDSSNNLSQTRGWTYDSLGRLLSLSQPESGTTTYSAFDVNKNPWVTNYNGSLTLNRTFDSIGRVTSVASPGAAGTASVSQTFTYDESGHGKGSNQLTSSIAGGISKSFTYSELNGRLSEFSETIDARTWKQKLSYNNYGQIQSRELSSPITDGGYSEIFSYDLTKAMPIGVEYGGQSLATLTNDPVIWTTDSISYNSASASSFLKYDADQTRLLRLRHLKGTETLADWNYTYNSAGQITTDGEDVYRYDPLRRLSEAFIRDPFDTSFGRGPSGIWQSFGYDVFGNRQSLKSGLVTNWGIGTVPQTPSNPESTNKSVPYEFPATDGALTKNQLPSYTKLGSPTGAGALSYDANGNLLRVFQKIGDPNSLITMTYDALGQVKTQWTSSTNVLEVYSYNDQGLRVMVEGYQGTTVALQNLLYKHYRIYNEARQLVSEFDLVLE